MTPLWAPDTQVSPFPNRVALPQAYRPGGSTPSCGCLLPHSLDLLPELLVKGPPPPSSGSQLLVIKVHKGRTQRPAQRNTCLPWGNIAQVSTDTELHAHVHEQAAPLPFQRGVDRLLQGAFQLVLYVILTAILR